MTGILKEDILSGYKGRRLYGVKGEKVDIIRIADNVALVRGKDTFPVHISRITIKYENDESKEQDSTGGTDTSTLKVR